MSSTHIHHPTLSPAWPYLQEVHTNAQSRQVDAALVQPHTHKQKQRHDDDEGHNEQPG
jgi:hypothetical protein